MLATYFASAPVLALVHSETPVLSQPDTPAANESNMIKLDRFIGPSSVEPRL